MVFTYPKVEKSNFVEDFHGEKIPDPFSPLEEPFERKSEGQDNGNYELWKIWLPKEIWRLLLLFL